MTREEFNKRHFDADCEFACTKTLLEVSIDKKYDNLIKGIVWGFMTEDARQAQLLKIRKERNKEKRREVAKLKRFIEGKYFGTCGKDGIEQSLTFEEKVIFLLPKDSFFKKLKNKQ